MKDSSKLISIIIPVFNEESVIKDCIESLLLQSQKDIEIIFVDDGSNDNTPEIIKKNSLLGKKLYYYHQKHLGPGSARNFGASKSKGEILVFVDADMTFDSNFISDLVRPIERGETIGTFSKNELVKNKENNWAKCWNINRNTPAHKMLPDNYPNEAPVFRAIFKKEFIKIKGFDTTGEYTDDWSLSRKLGIKSSAVANAKYYHSNPSNLAEIYSQARWIGKNEFISGNIIRRIRSLVMYSFPVSTAIGLFKSIRNNTAKFIIFKLIYDFAVWNSVIRSFFGESKAK